MNSCASLTFEATDESGRTAVMLAAKEGQTVATELLLGKGADVEARDEDGWTVLMLAAQEGQTAAMGLLLGKGADVEAIASHSSFFHLIFIVRDHHCFVGCGLFHTCCSVAWQSPHTENRTDVCGGPHAKSLDGATARCALVGEHAALSQPIFVDAGARSIHGP